MTRQTALPLLANFCCHFLCPVAMNTAGRGFGFFFLPSGIARFRTSPMTNRHSSQTKLKNGHEAPMRARPFLHLHLLNFVALSRTRPLNSRARLFPCQIGTAAGALGLRMTGGVVTAVKGAAFPIRLPGVRECTRKLSRQIDRPMIIAHCDHGGVALGQQ